MFTSSVDLGDHHTVCGCLACVCRRSRARRGSHRLKNHHRLDLVVAYRLDNPAYGSRRIAGDEAMNPSTGSTIMRQVGSAASASRSEKIESGPLVLSSLLQPSTGAPGLADFRTDPRQTISRSPNPAGAKVYSLLDDGPALGSFLYGYQANYLPSKLRLANNESVTHEVVQAPRPLFELNFGSWRLPVMLSGAAVSR